MTVRSGDRSATAANAVLGPPAGFQASDCPEGWYMVDVSVCYHGRTCRGRCARISLALTCKDPDVEARAVPTGDRLGAARTVGEAARARGSCGGQRRLLLLGARRQLRPGTDDVRGGLGQPRPRGRPCWRWTRRAVPGRRWLPSFVSIEASDGRSLPIQGVNDIPGPNAASVFNAHWGPVLSIGADGCAAVYMPTDGRMRGPNSVHCGPLPAWGCRWAAMWWWLVEAPPDWLWERRGTPVAADYAFPCEGPDLMVGGSHVLMKDGAPAPVPADGYHPRSMIGVDGNGFLYLVAVDGRGENSGGMTLPQLQAYAAALGLKNAINLDGGGSTHYGRRGAAGEPAFGRQGARGSRHCRGGPATPALRSRVRALRLTGFGLRLRDLHVRDQPILDRVDVPTIRSDRTLPSRSRTTWCTSTTVRPSAAVDNRSGVTRGSISVHWRVQ